MYLLFIIRCLTSKFKFFKLPPLQKARFLMDCHLYFEAGTIYMHRQHYSKAITCFKKCDAGRHLMYCYEKLGHISLAIEVAETHKLYEKGATLAKKYDHTKKAAYFYSFFAIPEAIKLYKKIEAYYELGFCYMQSNRLLKALETFSLCENPMQKAIGKKLIEEAAIVLYLRKHYHQAIELFTALGDFDSVLECAKKAHYKDLIQDTHKCLAKKALQEGNYLKAAYHIGPYDYHYARLYYYLHEVQNDTLILAIEKGHYYGALSLCFTLNHLPLASLITRMWLSPTEPLTSLAS